MQRLLGRARWDADRLRDPGGELFPDVRPGRPRRLWAFGERPGDDLVGGKGVQAADQERRVVIDRR
ncbi:hypothetical protein GCM10010246_03600 [Streptomyces cuspidosporus]|uniref:Uncharacterized protein n=1 Tax=Streptomyces cuspidosporus TaxID=66882 RepID=A0ABN3FB96_9ACTN